jgi:hypothetical protein
MSGSGLPGATGPALVRAFADLERLDGRPVEAVGRYEAIVAPRKGEPASTEPRDHAVIVLGDGTRLYLDALGSPAARRSKDELDACDGVEVRVAGTARRQMPAEGATLLAPCLEAARVIGPAGSAEDPGNLAS